MGDRKTAKDLMVDLQEAWLELLTALGIKRLLDWMLRNTGFCLGFALGSAWATVVMLFG